MGILVPDSIVSEKKEASDIESSRSNVIDGGFDEKRSRVSVAVDNAIRKNPDQQAKISALADKSGLPAEVVESEYDEVDVRVKRRDIDLDNFIKNAPTIANKFQYPAFANISVDDLDNLVALENVVRNRALSYTGKMKANFRKNQAMLEGGDIGMKGIAKLYGHGEGITDADRERYKRLQETMQYKYDGSFAGGIPIESVGQLPFLFDIAKSASAGAVIMGGAAYLGALAVGKNPAAAGAAGRVGLKVGGTGGMWVQVFNVEAGNAFMDYVDGGMDEEVARDAAVTVGALNAVLESLSLTLLGRTFTGAKPLLRQRVKQMLTTEPGRLAIQRVGAKYAESVGGEMTTEVLQEVSQIFGKAFGDAITEHGNTTQAIEAGFAALKTDEAHEAFKESAKVAAQASGGIAGVPTVVNIARAKAQQAKDKSQADQQRIDQIVTTAEESKVRERAPETYRQTIDDLVEEIQEETGEVNEIYWTAEEAEKWLDSENIDVNEKAPNPAVESIINQLPEALATDGYVKLSLADFATDIAPSENFSQTVRAHVKMSEKGLTLEEYGNYDETVAKRIKKMLADAKVSVEEQRQSQAIWDDVQAQLIETKQLSPEVAKYSAALYPAYFNVYAKRKGISIEAAYAQAGIQIVGPEIDLGNMSFEQVIDSDVFKDKLDKRMETELKTAFLERTAAEIELHKLDNPVEEEKPTLSLVPDPDAAKPSQSDTTKDIEAKRAELIKQRDAADQKVKAIARRAGISGDTFKQSVFHGSPHKFDIFDLGAIGTGEGAQAYGHGLYFAENPGVAKSYQNMLGKGAEVYLDGKPWEPAAKIKDMALDIGRLHGKEAAVKYFDEFGGQNARARKAIEEFDYSRFKTEPGSHLYEVDIADETIAKMLDWDAPLSEQQKKVFRELGVEPGFKLADGKIVGDNISGQEAYNLLGRHLSHGKHPSLRMQNALGDQLASKALNEAGIPGIRYYDGSSRAGAGGTFKVTKSKHKNNRWVAHARGVSGQSKIKAFDNKEDAEAWAKKTNEGTRNIVVFDPKDINQVKRDGKEVYNAKDGGTLKQGAVKLDSARLSIPNWGKNLSLPGSALVILQNPSQQELAKFRKDIRADFHSRGLNPNANPLTRQTFDTDGNKWVWNSADGTHETVEAAIKKKVGDRELSQTFYQDDGGIRGEYLPIAAGGPIIRLTQARNLSTFLHESGHLFLDLEQQFYESADLTETQQKEGAAILKFLGVEQWSDIGTEQHEKWAKAFEAYLYEGKAPSVELRSAFRRFSAWLKDIYKGLVKLDVKLTPEITEVFDRMLATEEQLAEVQADMSLEPLFQTAEEARMTPEEFQAYREQGQGEAEEKLYKKALGILRTKATKLWNKELYNVQKDVQEELAAEPLYRAIAFLRATDPPEGFDQNKLDRRAVYEMLGLVPAKEPKSDPNEGVNTDIDSLSVAIAKLGGLDREEAEAQGIDPAVWRNIKRMKMKDGKKVFVSVPNPDNMPIGLKRLFKKEGGKKFDGMRETLAELGYIESDSSASDLLELLLNDMSGDTQYSVHADYDLLFERPEESQQERLVAPAQIRGLTTEGGMHPDAVAEIFGFASGQELVRQIASSPTLTFATVKRANRIMLERHGDVLNDGTLEQEAREASHGTEQGSKLLKELRALAGLTDVRAVTERQAISDAAERIIAGKRISELRPARYHAAEIKAAREAQIAKDAGNLQEAQEAKQKQVFNFYLWRAATAARKTSEKTAKRLQTMQTKKYSERQADPKYVTRFKQLLKVYRFTQSKLQPAAQADELAKVKAWIKSQQSESDVDLLNADALVSVKHWKDLTLDQLQAVNDVATNLLYSGRKNSAEEKAAFKADMKEIAETVVASVRPKSDIGREDTWIRNGRIKGRAVAATHRKLESLVREADGFEDLGPLWKRIVRPLLHAMNKKLQMQEEAHDALERIFENHEGLFNPLKDKRTFRLDSGKDFTLSLGGRVSVALNMGNSYNREALLSGSHTPLTENDLNTIVATLTDADWDMVQQIGDFLSDTYWPQIQELEKATTGVAPLKVEGEPFTTPSGRVMKGWYYPLKADPALSSRRSKQDIEALAERLRSGGGMAHAHTKAGATITRKDWGGQDVDLSIKVLFNHVDEIIHDISHRQAVAEVDRVLANRDIKAALTTVLGAEAYKAMISQVTTVAAGHIHPQELSAPEGVLRYARLALTYGALGFSVKTGFSQMLGLATAIGEFGASNVSRGVIEFYKDPVDNAEFIKERSTFMRDRVKTVNRDTGEILRNLKGNTKMNALKEKAFFLLLQGDLMVSRAVWWGQYEVGMERLSDPAFPGFNVEQDAIDYADRAVSRTQQSGLLMDLATIESKNEFVKMWTVMYSAFSAIYQIALEQGKKGRAGKISKTQMTYNLMWVLIVPALFEELMVGRDEGDDDDELKNWKRYGGAVAGFSLGTMAGLREVGWLMKTGQNSGLPVQRVLKTPFDVATQVKQGELDAALIRSMTSALSLAHIPGGSQANRTASYLLAVYEGDEEIDSVTDVWELLVTGPREDK